MKNRMFLTGAFCLLFSTAGLARIELAPQRYPIPVDGQICLAPYYSSHDLNRADAQIERLILSIHSSVYDAKLYYDNARAAIARAGEDPKKNLIIAPHFLNAATIRKEISTRMPVDTLYWQEYPYWGVSRGVYNSRRVRVSAYDVVDRMLEDLVTSGRFPNLKSIVILGHSAGGQMVNRYAAGSRFEFDTARPRGIEVRYLVMAPSTCVYFTPERAAGEGGGFCTPARTPADFNVWGYGLDGLFPYHQRCGVTADWIKEHYGRRRVLYLVGDLDTDPSDPSLASTPSAMLLGKNRLERAKIYIQYLRHLYGEAVAATQRFESVPNAGHSGRQLMTSRPALAFIFGRDAAGTAVVRASDLNAEE